VIVVLVMVSVIAALALPRVDVGRYRADGLVQIVRKTMQQAQRSSLIRQHDVIVSFDTAQQRMRIALDANNDGSISTGEIITWQAFSDGGHFGIPSRSLTGGSAPSAPIVATDLKTVSSMPTVTFRRDGSVSTDVTIYFTTRSGPVTDFRAVTIAEGTGRADWYRFNGTTWRAGQL
jgi:hypothetical protein